MDLFHYEHPHAVQLGEEEVSPLTLKAIHQAEETPIPIREFFTLDHLPIPTDKIRRLKLEDHLFILTRCILSRIQLRNRESETVQF